MVFNSTFCRWWNVNLTSHLDLSSCLDWQPLLESAAVTAETRACWLTCGLFDCCLATVLPQQEMERITLKTKTISWNWNQWRTSHFRLSAVSCYLPVSDLFHLFLLFCFLCLTVSRCCPKAPFLHLTEVWGFFNHIVWRCLSTDRQSKLSCLIDAGLSGSSEAAAPKASCPLPQEAAIGKNIEGKTMLCQRLFTAGREKHEPGEHGTWLPVATANVTDVLWCLTIIDFLFYDADDCEI